MLKQYSIYSYTIGLFWLRVVQRVLVGPTAEMVMVDDNYVARANITGRLVGGRADVGPTLLYMAALDALQYVIESDDFEVPHIETLLNAAVWIWF